MVGRVKGFLASEGRKYEGGDGHPEPDGGDPAPEEEGNADQYQGEALPGEEAEPLIVGGEAGLLLGEGGVGGSSQPFFKGCGVDLGGGVGEVGPEVEGEADGGQASDDEEKGGKGEERAL